MILIIIVYVFAQPIVGLFGLGSGAAVYCVAHTRCIALCLIPFASYFPLLGVFQGADIISAGMNLGNSYWNVP